MSIIDLEIMQGGYKSTLDNLRSSISLAKAHNDQIDILSNQIKCIDELMKKLEIYEQKLKLVKASCITTEHNYQTKRINYLNVLITDALKEVYPEEDFKARILYDFHRKDTVQLELYDSNGNISSPDIGQGQLMQYVISLIAIIGITSGLGYKNLYIDEAFGVADVMKLPELGEIINKYVQKGMQIILVSQNPVLYNSIPHRVFKLEKNPVTGITTVVKTEDFQ